MATKAEIETLIDNVGTRLSMAHEAIGRYNALGFSHAEIGFTRERVEEAGGFMAQLQTAFDSYAAPAPAAPITTKVGGVNFTLAAPLNPDYKPSMEELEFGRDGASVGDPGSPPGARSPSGYPQANGCVLYGGQTFTDEAALAQYKVAVAARDAQEAQTGGQFSPYTPKP